MVSWLLSIDVLEYTTSLVVIIKEAGCFARQKNSLAPRTKNAEDRKAQRTLPGQKVPRTGRKTEARCQGEGRVCFLGYYPTLSVYTIDTLRYTFHYIHYQPNLIFI
jgi:hypothetical protein